MIIGFLGRKGSGKDTIAEYLIKNKNFVRYAFGDPVKDVVKQIFLFSDEQLHGNKKEIKDLRWNISPRQAFQAIGTDFGQYTIHKHLSDINEVVPLRNLWVKRFEMWLELNQGKNIVISDVRFQHEIDCIKKYNGIIVKIIRPSSNNDLHISENEIDSVENKNISLILNNDSSIQELYNKFEGQYQTLVNE